MRAEILYPTCSRAAYTTTKHINIYAINIYAILGLCKMRYSLKPVSGRDFIDRKETVDAIVGDMASEDLVGYVLHGVRRMGKTSIILEACNRMRLRPDTVPVYISAWERKTSVEHFAKELGMEIIHAYSKRLDIEDKLKDKVHNILAELKNLRLGTRLYDDLEYFIALDWREEDGFKTFEKALNLGDELAHKYKTKTILCIDEFPSLMDLTDNNRKVGDALIAFIRTRYEQLSHTKLIVTGSIKHTLDLCVFEPASPFFQQLKNLRIEPMQDKYIEKIITANNPKTKFEKQALQYLVKYTAGIPLYAQAIGQELQKTKGKISHKTAKDAIDSFMSNTGHILYTSTLEQLTETERSILVLLSNDVGKAGEISKHIQNTSSYTNVYIRYLLDKGLIKRVDRGEYEHTDPIFKQWLQGQENIGRIIRAEIKDNPK